MLNSVSLCSLKSWWNICLMCVLKCDLPVEFTLVLVPARSPSSSPSCFVFRYVWAVRANGERKQQQQQQLAKHQHRERVLGSRYYSRLLPWRHFHWCDVIPMAVPMPKLSLLSIWMQASAVVVSSCYARRASITTLIHFHRECNVTHAHIQ